MGTLAGKTYEVQVDQGGGRWSVVELHETRNASIEQARKFLENGKYGGVRVVAESERAGLKTIFEEVVEGFDDRPVSIVSIDVAPLCKSFDDFFELDARRTVGRVLRNYIERQGHSVLELMYDASDIRILENNETLFPQAIQQIAGAQARGTDIKPAVRADELYRAVTQVRKKAVSVAGDDTGYRILKDNGIDALIAEMNKRHGTGEAPYFIRHAFARYLGDGAEWNSKLKLLSKLGADGLSDDAVAYLDEVLAEILDGRPCLQELSGKQPDLASFMRVLIDLSRGHVKPKTNAFSCLDDINDLMARFDMVWARRVLLERVASFLGGVNRLTKGGPDDERKVFTLIIQDLTDVAGVMGGVEMCGAVIRRARLAFSKDVENLTFPDAIERIINLLPHRAARIGYLAELSLAPVVSDHKALIMSTLASIVEQLTCLASLVPSGSSHGTMLAAVEGLEARLTSEEIPFEWREALSGVFKTLAAKPESVMVERKAQGVKDEEFQAMLKEKPKQKNVSKGEVLFEEGDHGNEAYLILAGTIEVFKRAGGRDHVIATLGKGEIIGEMSLIDNQPRMASARVLDNTKLMVITQQSLNMRLHRLEQEDRVVRRLLDVLVNRLRGDAQAGV